jgi:uncharacterized membrane protein YbhN (UPF0104 family)
MTAIGVSDTRSLEAKTGKRMKGNTFLLQLLTSAVCLTAGVTMVSPGALLEAFARAKPGALAVVYLLMPLALFSRAWRWAYIIERNKVNVPLTTICRATLIGHAYNLILPASLGDIVRSYYGWRDQGNKEVMLGSAVVDKVVALFTLCLLGIACALVVRAYPLALVTLALTLPIALLLFIPQIVPWNWGASLFKKLSHRDLSVEQLFATFRLDFHTFLGCVAISLIGWGVTNAMYFFAWAAFSQNVSIWYAFAIAPLINLTRVLPISISGLGSADLLIVFLLRSVNVNDSDALMGSMAINVALIALPGLIGAVLMPVGCQQGHPSQ